MESPLAFVLVLVYVLSSSAYSLIVKMSGNRLVLFGAVNGATVLLVLPVFLFLPLPELYVLPYILASSAFYCTYLYFSDKAYKHADLSVVYPLSRTVSFLLIILASKFVLGEEGRWYEWLAIGVILVAFLMQMNIRQLHKIHHLIPFLLIGLMGAGVGAMASVDIMGVRATASPMSFIAALMFTGLPATVWATIKHKHELQTILIRQKKQIIAAALLENFGYVCFLYAVYVARALYAVPLSSLTVVVVTLLGLYHLKESMRLRRLLSAAMITAAIAGVHTMDIFYR